MKKRRKRLTLRAPSRATAGWILVLTAAAGLQVWLQLRTIELGYEIGLLRQMLRRMASEHADLEAERASLTSPRALDHLARSRLGLRSPGEGQVIGLP